MKIFLQLSISLLCCCFLAGCVHEEQTQHPAVTQASEPGAQGQVIDVTRPEAGSGQIPNQNPGTNGAARMISPALQ